MCMKLKRMLPDGSGAGRGGAGAEPAVEAPGVPTFNLDELNECIGEKLGGGVFGDVYSLRGFPRLAVKEIRLDGQPDRLKEITKFELEALSQFSHPGVLKYHQVIEDGDFSYVVMDRYDGDLQHFIADHARNRRSIPKEVIHSIVSQLAEALAYVHAPYKVNEKGDVLPGIVHRDLKPANILMSGDGERVVIAGFGHCKDAQHDGSTFVGMPFYMAPETFIHRKTSRASDIWALGVIIYELAVLKKPSFTRMGRPEDAKEFFVDGWKPDLSAVDDDFIRTILEKIFVLDPAKRPTARELAELFNLSISSARMLRLRVASLEEALATADARTGTLEEAITALQSRIDAQSVEIASLRATLDGVAALSEAKGQPVQAPGGSLDLNKHRPSNQQAASRDITLLSNSLASKYSPSWTPLMRAAVAGDIWTAKRHRSDKDKKNSNGDTAYTLAARAGQGAILELLDPTDKDGVTALMRAAVRGDVDAVRALIPLQKGRKADYLEIEGWLIYGGTALMMAAVCGHTEAVRLLVEHERDLKDGIGRTALIFAAKSGHAECVALLLEKEAGMQDRQGWTALMWAVYNNKLECAKLLLERERNMKTTRKWFEFPPGTTALDIAKKKGYKEIVSILQ